MKAVIMAHKLAVLPQVREVLTRYPIDEVTFVYPTEGGRMSERALRERLAPWLNGKSISYLPLNFFEEMPAYHALLRNGNWDLAALPLVGGRPYYRARRLLRKGVRFVVMSDGSSECSSLWDFYRRLRVHTAIDYAKAAIMAAEVLLYARGDEAYSLFHPLPCCFAKRTYQARPLPVSPERAERIRRMVPGPGLVDYVAQGYGVKFEEAVRKFGLQNAITTIKRPLDSDDFFTGEDIVDVLRPRRIMGYCCEVLMYARKFSPESECIVIMDPETDRMWGRQHNRTFRKQSKLFGDMRFMSYDEYTRL